MATLLYRLGAFAVRRRWAVLVVWILLLAGIGALFAAFGRWGERLGWKGRQSDAISFRRPGDVVLTPAQRATAYFFLVVGLLFLIQTLVGAASEHYRADVASFFGFDLARWLPYNVVRTWHVQLSIFWTAASRGSCSPTTVSRSSG